MYIYDEIYEEVFYSSKIFDYYFKDSEIPGEENAQIGVFDIETTGLSPQNGQVIIGGLITIAVNGLRIRQFFAEDDGEEEELLIKYKEALDEVDVLISYNGNSFDFPYLKYRLKRHGLDSYFGRFLSLDMYIVLKRYSNFRKVIPNLKQTTVEEYLGIDGSRDDMIDGGQSVELYFRYLINKSEKLRDTMLLHNRDDILQLSRIQWAFDQLDLHRIAAHTGFPIVSDDKKVFVSGIRLKTKHIEINGRYKGITGRYKLFRDDCTVSLEPLYEKTLIAPESDHGEIKIDTPLRKEGGNTFIRKDDLEIAGGDDYYILMKDGEPDHRQINRFVKHMIRDIIEKI